MPEERKDILKNVKRVLVKVGTGTLTGTDGLDIPIIEQLVDEIAGYEKKACSSSWSRRAPSLQASTAWDSREH